MNFIDVRLDDHLTDEETVARLAQMDEGGRVEGEGKGLMPTKLKDRLYLEFLSWFQIDWHVEFWNECNAPEELAEIACRVVEELSDANN